ncbi:hypothetical protein B0T17DRAFT_523570 [Bombardia bombarda]|uniref:Uncharacterized protein n=1 Tax=Bombardia bombarda TaxID=252184 RepID=A0AA39X7G3_9PEZI|nr:hypothetical protein B0T17DRAFT_523570 [Bombardia bombarda]
MNTFLSTSLSRNLMFSIDTTYQRSRPGNSTLYFLVSHTSSSFLTQSRFGNYACL